MSLDKRELKEIIESSNINFLVGAGLSVPFLPVLGNIEEAIENAETDEQVTEQLKLYFNGVMVPVLDVPNKGANLSTTRPSADELSPKEKFDVTYGGYKELFDSVNSILLNRKSTLLTKQVNVFTTNIDIMMESVLEDSNFEYNDGFVGNINPSFETSNFYKSIFKTSAHFDNRSEIPTFNVVKLHGSLSWSLVGGSDTITYSDLKQVEVVSEQDNDEAFNTEYGKLQVVNPTKEKFKETVMGVTFYELLRMYSGQLEKENSVLFVLGFSMADEHIREITKRAANSNPTLKIYLFCYSDGLTKTNFEEWFSDSRYQNIEIVVPDGDDRYDIKTVNELYFKTILDNEKKVEIETPLEPLEETGDGQQ
jgi:NAD-dependent SIR2 family protein deacetylase